MVKRTGPTNYFLRKLIRNLKKASRRYNAKIWETVSEKLSAPTRRRIAVNLSKIERYVRDGEYALVPGKVLGAGSIKRPITVVAYAFSAQAKKKIEEAGGKCLTIEEFININPRGSNTRIIG
ncbi:MAG: 50S ribosomal protein L18e [Candidatus Methanomethylicota archaeon]|uniref:Large ribosomal subunit protein eL18 n=1 Tax=Thermoproteota archaeon TaxID=2056631 RepID=A0A497EYK6_9CREN|nr:MAG: 50S ribosomal protein L18e [Candidatus Verstraetearchaeota archaeon]RLE52474.1 MAG: 50S ribosomal protein L18e [Candidatus Verstraetearchaeota archaeon]